MPSTLIKAYETECYKESLNPSAGKPRQNFRGHEIHADRKVRQRFPKLIRDCLRIKTRDGMSFTLMPDGFVVMRVKNKRVSELAGMLHRKGRKPVPIERLSR